MTLANLVDTNITEAWTVYLDNFIQKNARGFMDFINFISTNENKHNETSCVSTGLTSLWQPVLALVPEQLNHIINTVEDIPIPPYNIDLPLELARFVKNMARRHSDPSISLSTSSSSTSLSSAMSLSLSTVQSLSRICQQLAAQQSISVLSNQSTSRSKHLSGVIV
ncbi:uncharacterized protein BYT42DRAFT_188116 [Radiomyces spectabilis]|uniref:uncharacterized protein n=1 Tax=Radiomyces spectabilis TaxID=64574 RepID=UPI00222044FF|nr:uncharacterized protein BYT42DRAFT_188116 [Radiomyces spectabilis]KAI8391268.1 hypothetical protein BYT42DRAFT_188116 [Radiomyces spectabilis]